MKTKKQIWVKMVLVDDPVLGEKVRMPDFGDYQPRMFRAVVGEPYGKHPDLPKFRKPLGDYMLVEMDDIDAEAFERGTSGKALAEADVPDEIRMITELTLCGPKPELKRFRFDNDKANAALKLREDTISEGPVARARVRRVLQRMVAQGVMPTESALRLAKAHKVEEEQPTQKPKP